MPWPDDSPMFILLQHPACYVCNGFYGSSFGQPVCGTCHLFLFPQDINVADDPAYPEVGFSSHLCLFSMLYIYLVFVFINPCIFPYVYIYVPNSRRVTTFVRIFTYRKYNGTMGWSHIFALFVWHPFCCEFLSIFEKPQFVVVWSAFWCTFLCNGDCSW